MLQITKRVDYAMIALTHLALHTSERFSARGLAEAYELSRPLMANVLKDLAREGIVDSLRGTKGGYELALTPASISVGRLVELLEGPLQLAQCVGDRDLGCKSNQACPVKHSVLKIQLEVRDVLYGHTIASLCDTSGLASPCATPMPTTTKQ